MSNWKVTPGGFHRNLRCGMVFSLYSHGGTSSIRGSKESIWPVYTPFAFICLFCLFQCMRGHDNKGYLSTFVQYKTWVMMTQKLKLGSTDCTCWLNTDSFMGPNYARYWQHCSVTKVNTEMLCKFCSSNISDSLAGVCSSQAKLYCEWLLGWDFRISR